MFKLIGWVLKTGFFIALVLILSHTIHWKGRTVSDQVRMGMAQTERMISKVSGSVSGSTAALKKAAGEPAVVLDRIPPTEKQKLQALIRELNGETRR